MANAVAIALTVTAIAGPELNPALADLTNAERLRFAFFAAIAHLFARWAVRGLEDR